MTILESLPWLTTAYFVSEWVIRLAMLVYVPQKRTPSAARSWLLLIFVLPWPGLALYAVFGRPYLPKGMVEQRHRVARIFRTKGRELQDPFVAHPQLSRQFQQSIKLAESLGDFPILAGNQIELISDYEGSIDRLLADIAAAKRHGRRHAGEFQGAVRLS